MSGTGDEPTSNQSDEGSRPDPDSGDPRDKERARALREHLDRLAERRIGSGGEGTDGQMEELKLFEALKEEFEAHGEAGRGGAGSRIPEQFGPYRIIREIGRGGMGIVYEAWQAALGRRVALKVIHSWAASEEKAWVRFRREAKIAAGLRHANIVSVFDLGTIEGTLYFTMEYVEGETLQQLGQRIHLSTNGWNFNVQAPHGSDSTTLWTFLSSGDGPPIPRPSVAPPAGTSSTVESRDAVGSSSAGAPLEEQPAALSPPSAGSRSARHVFFSKLALATAGAADGLHHAHTHKVLHRDVKPSNLILDLDGRLRLLDFGLARIEGSLSVTGSKEFVGTIAYMSPEVARGGHDGVGRGADIYSLGATLYDVLTGRPVFRSSSTREAIEQIVREDPVPVRRVNPDVPRDLETIVMHCLHKRPGDRYLTAAALADDLRRFARGDPIEARPPAALTRFVRRALRYKARILQGSLVLALSLAVGLHLHSVALRNDRENLAETEALLCSGSVAWVLPQDPCMGIGPAYADSCRPGGGEMRVVPQSEQPRSVRIQEGGVEFGSFAVEGGLPRAWKSLEILDDARGNRPGDPRGDAFLALAHLFLGHREEAGAHLSKALSDGFRTLHAAALQRLFRKRQVALSPGVGVVPVKPRDAPWVDAWVAAYDALLERDWRSARPWLEEVLRLTPGKDLESPCCFAAMIARGVCVLETARDSQEFTPASDDFLIASERWRSRGAGQASIAVEPLLLLGTTYVRRGELRSASRYLSRVFAAASSPREKEDAVLRIVSAYRQGGLFRTGEASLQGDDPLQQAEKWLAPKAAVPQTGRILREKAELRFLQGNLEDATKDAKEALDRLQASRPDPGKAASGAESAWRGEVAATCAVLAGIKLAVKPKEALGDAEQALRAAPDDPRLLLALGLAREATGDAEGARDDFRQAADVADWYAPAHVHLARALRAAGDLKGEEKQYSAALRAHPASVAACNGLGLIRLRQHRICEAKDLFDLAARMAPHLPQPHYNLALLLQKLNRFDDAIKHYEAALKGGCENWAVHNNLGAVQHLRTTHRKEALEHFKKARELWEDSHEEEPSPAGLLFNLVHAYFKLGQTQEGKAKADSEEAMFRVLREAVAAHPRNAEAPLELSYYLENSSRPREALKWGREAARRDPTCGTALNAVASYYLADNDWNPDGAELEEFIGLFEEGEAHGVLRADGRTCLEDFRERFLRDRSVPPAASLRSADWLLERESAVSLVDRTASWKFLRRGKEPAEDDDWKGKLQGEYPAKEWEKGRGGFGYGGAFDAFITTKLPAMREGNGGKGYGRVFLRTEFMLSDPQNFEDLVLRVLFDDGVVVFLNGEELLRRNAGDRDSPIPLLATGHVGSPAATAEVPIPPSLFRPGRNVLAVVGLNGTLNSSDFLVLATIEGTRRGGNGTRRRPGGLREEDVSGDVGVYLEARTLQKRGLYRRAAEKFETLVNRPDGATAILRLAECRLCMGEADVSLQTICQGLRTKHRLLPPLWDLWRRIALCGLAKEPSKALQLLPGGGAAQEDMRWILESLRDGHAAPINNRAVRINAGGDAYVGKDRRFWGRDVFSVAGFPYTGFESAPAEIEQTKDDPLYQTERSWDVNLGAEWFGYRIPLLCGSYKVTLHFDETWHRSAGNRVFDILLEGKPVYREFDPYKKAGARGRAAICSFPGIRVEDGRLDIRFVPRIGNPQVCAVEITMEITRS